MHKISIYLLFLFLLLGCDKDTPKEHDDMMFDISDDNISQNDIDTFTITDRRVTVSDKKVIFHTVQQGVLLVNIFGLDCEPCVEEIKYLNFIQQKYSNDVFVIGVVTDETNQTKLDSFVNTYHIKYPISNDTQNTMFVSLLAKGLKLEDNYDKPLLALYAEGRYIRHYEGIVPIEMIEYDIKQAIKQSN